MGGGAVDQVKVASLHADTESESSALKEAEARNSLLRQTLEALEAQLEESTELYRGKLLVTKECEAAGESAILVVWVVHIVYRSHRKWGLGRKLEEEIHAQELEAHRQTHAIAKQTTLISVEEGKVVDLALCPLPCSLGCGGLWVLQWLHAQVADLQNARAEVCKPLA